MSAQHTPGPWVVGNNEPDRVFAACDEDGRQFGAPIFEEPFRGYGSLAFEKPNDESIANARLIAAAPELLADGQFVCDRLGELDDSDPEVFVRQFYGHVLPALERLRATIAKATGAA
jgi:hypothetical protein